jgi:hypothetical protein
MTPQQTGGREMKIEVHYLRADGTDVVEVIERDCETKE